MNFDPVQFISNLLVREATKKYKPPPKKKKSQQQQIVSSFGKGIAKLVGSAVGTQSRAFKSTNKLQDFLGGGFVGGKKQLSTPGLASRKRIRESNLPEPTKIIKPIVTHIVRGTSQKKKKSSFDLAREQIELARKQQSGEVPYPDFRETLAQLIGIGKKRSSVILDIFRPKKLSEVPISPELNKKERLQLSILRTKAELARKEAEAYQKKHKINRFLAGASSLLFGKDTKLLDPLEEMALLKKGTKAEKAVMKKKEEAHKRYLTYMNLLARAERLEDAYRNFANRPKTPIEHIGAGLRQFGEAIEEPSRVIPLIGSISSAREQRLAMKIANKQRKNQPLTALELAQLGAFRAKKEEDISQQYQGVAGQVGATIPQIAKFGGEVYLLGGAEPTKVANVATAVKELVKGAAQGLLNVPLIDEKAATMVADYSYPELQPQVLKAKKILDKDKISWAEAYKRAVGSTMAEYSMERLGTVIAQPMAFLKNATIGKFLANRGIKVVDKTTSSLLRKMGWNGILSEIIEEEATEALQAPIEKRKYAAPWTTEGKQRLLAEALGIGIYGSLLNLPNSTVAKIYAQRGKGYINDWIAETQPGALSIKEVGGKPTTKEAIARENVPIPQQQGIQPEQLQETLQKYLKTAQRVRGAQEALYTKERSKRTGKMVNISKDITGEARLNAKLSIQKGELPKVQFKTKFDLDQKTRDGLMDQIEYNPAFTAYEKLNAQIALRKLAEKQLPTQSELELLQRQFGKDIVDIIPKVPKGKIKKFLINTVGLFRALMTTGEFSHQFRQALWFSAWRPNYIPKMTKKSLSYLFSQKNFNELYESIRKNPLTSIAMDNRPYIYKGKEYKQQKLDIIGFLSKVRGLGEREEAFMTEFAEYVPGVKQFERAYVGGLDFARITAFYTMAEQYLQEGYTVENDPHLFASLKKWINVATGRGPLGALESNADIINTVLFSPRLLSSRIQLFNPRFYANLHPKVRKEAFKALFRLIGIGGSIMSLAALAGAEVEKDPRSSDFGKIKIGKTRIDIWGGHQQFIRTAVQLITGQYKSSTTGFIVSNKGEYGERTRMDILQSFVESKTAPAFSFVIDLLKGETFTGEKPFLEKKTIDTPIGRIQVPSTLANRLIPMYWQDIHDAIKESGFLKGLALTAVPGFFGIGIQTYGASGQAGIREKIREGKMTEEMWQEEIAKGTIPDSPERQAEIIREAQMPEQVVAFSNMTTEEQIALLPTFTDEQIKKATWGANNDTISWMKKTNPKKWASLGLDKVIYQKNMELEYRSEYKKRGLDLIEATKNAYQKATENMKDPVYQRLCKIGYNWTFPSNKVGDIKLPPKVYAPYAKEAEAKTYSAYKTLLPQIKSYTPEIQKIILMEKRDKIRNDLRNKYFGKYYAANKLKKKLIKRGYSTLEAERVAGEKYLK